MKTVLYLTLSGLLFNSTVLAQTPNRTHIYVRAGVGASRVNATGQGILTMHGVGSYATDVLTTQTDAAAVLTGTAGLGFAIDASKHFTIGAELTLEQKGSNAPVDATVYYCTGGNCGIIYIRPSFNRASGQLASRLTYLTLPVLAGYYMGQFSVYAGPYLGVKLAERQRGRYTSDQIYLDTPDYSGPVDASSNQFNPFDVGLTAGVGYALTSRFVIDLRYSQSTSQTIRSQPAYSQAARFSAYNQTAQFAVRYNLMR